MKRGLLICFMLLSLLSVACESIENSYEVTIDCQSEIKIGMYGEDITISYDIHGIEDVQATITLSNETWLRIKSHDYRTITLSADDNNTGGSRMAALTISYNGSTQSIIINQSGEAIAPIITSLSGDEIEIERSGCKVIIEYKLENRNPSYYVYAKTSADWIYSINTNTDGRIELSAATNTTQKLRSTVITVGYGTAKFDITLNQRGDGKMNFLATTISGEYLGDGYTPGVGNYWFILSDRGFNGDGTAKPIATYYRIDAYGTTYNGNDSVIPIAPGTYTFDKDNTYATGTFTAEYSGHWVTNKDGKRDGAITTFDSGTLVVESGKITLDVAIAGEEHHVEYVGDTTIKDSQSSVTIYSTLDGDYEADLSDHYLIYECYGDCYECGFTNWMIVIKPNNGTTGDCFQFDFITDKTTREEGFCGDYISSDFIATNSFIPGWTDNVNLLCSWYFNVEQTELAPFRGGKMTIKDNNDGTITVDIDVKDDLRNSITGSWTGIPQPFQDQQ